MIRYCEKCRDFHEENDICPKYKEQLKKHPEWLGEVANFANVAAQYQLVTSQALDGVASTINKIAGTNLAYEGTRQVAHDIMTFRQLDVDPFSKMGAFRTPGAAKSYVDAVGKSKSLMAKLGGTSHEVDVLMRRKGEIFALWSKTELLGENTHNAPGIDGVTKVFKIFGGKETGFSVKSTQYNITPGHSTMSSVFHSIERGDFKPGQVLEGTEGYRKAFFDRLETEIAKATQAGDLAKVEQLNQFKNTKVIETGTAKSVRADADRLYQKASDGKASTSITGSEMGAKMAQGAIIGAVVSLSISSIINYVKYKNGEITGAEAFREIGEDAVKGAITGGAMAGITLFLPGGIIGFVAGMAIGMYINAVCTNALDEVFGKGVYEQILHSCGYITGMAKNVVELLDAYGTNMRAAYRADRESQAIVEEINATRTTLEAQKQRTKKLIEEL